MDILNLFLKFIDAILNFPILGIEISAYLITITAIILIFAAIKAMIE